MGRLSRAAWAVVVPVLGTAPGHRPDFDWIDKAWHFLGYGALTGTLLLAAVWRPGRGDGRLPRAGLWVAGLVLTVAWLTEALQAPFDRDVELLDALADLGGVLAGYAVWRMLARAPRAAATVKKTAR